MADMNGSRSPGLTLRWTLAALFLVGLYRIQLCCAAKKLTRGAP